MVSRFTHAASLAKDICTGLLRKAGSMHVVGASTR